MTEISDIDNCLYLFNTKRLMSLYVFFFFHQANTNVVIVLAIL